MDEDEVVLHLMDCLLPGGAGFPSARGTGMAGLLAGRLRQADPAGPGRLLAALLNQGKLPGSPTAWTEVASRLEVQEPKLFGEFRRYAYLTYYEQPAVIDAIRALGFRYNSSPLPDGYPEDFDPARDAPRHARGCWTDTGDIRPINLASLGLETPR